MEESLARNVNVFLLGLAFLLTFTAFQTMGNIQTVIIDSAKNENSTGYVEGFTGEGQVSLAIIYAVSAVFNWLAPSAMAFMGLKITLLIGAVTYALYIATFFALSNALLYSGSALIGVGAALIWTAQGAFLTVNSNSETMSRNSGIFWAMLQMSLIIGNTFAYFQFTDLDDIDPDTRNVTVGALLGMGIAGVVTFLFLLPTPWMYEDNPLAQTDSPMKALKRSFALFLTPEMLQLLIFFFYMGLQLTFWSGVYGPSLSFTEAFEDPSGLTGLHGVFVGVGEILGGLIFGIFGHVTNKFGRYPVVILGTVVQFTAFILVFVNIPNTAPLGDTFDVGYIVPPSPELALFSSALLGFGDACYNTQTMSLLGGVYPENAGPAFAIFKFVQCIACAAGFGYTSYVKLYPQIGAMWGLGLVGTFFFVKIDIETRRKAPKVIGRKGSSEGIVNQGISEVLKERSHESSRSSSLSSIDKKN